MSAVNQLIAKAMSTASEEEAIACIRMARKKGGTFDGNIESSDFNGHDAKYWYDKASLYYNEAKNAKLNNQTARGLTVEQQKYLLDSYQAHSAETAGLRLKITRLEIENKSLDGKLTDVKALHIVSVAIITILTFVIISLI